MYRVVKRDGKIKDFNIEKIVDAITLAFEAKGKEDKNIRKKII